MYNILIEVHGINNDRAPQNFSRIKSVVKAGLRTY